MHTAEVENPSSLQCYTQTHSKLLSHPSYKLHFAAGRFILSPNFLRLVCDLLQQLEVPIVAELQLQAESREEEEEGFQLGTHIDFRRNRQ